MIDTSANSSFSKKLPGMQLAVDSTSLGAFKTCPRLYQYSIIEGYQPKGGSPHLIFGIAIHHARETYDHERQRRASHDDALDAALQEALLGSWDKELSRPWVSDHPIKNRKTLIQTIVWYLDALGSSDPITTHILSNGNPAIELSFRFDSGVRTGEGEIILLCGHIDRIGHLNEPAYIIDIKTSGDDVTGFRFLNQFSPSNQFSLYRVAGRIAFGIDVKDLIVDGIQVGVGFARFHRHLITSSEAQLEEWLSELPFWTGSMERCATASHWPMNDKSCTMYGGCQFQKVCKQPPSVREMILKNDYTKRVWDPLQVRGPME